MLRDEAPSVLELTRSHERARGLQVLRRVYREEKEWGEDLDVFFPASDLDRREISWFLAELGGSPCGVIRVQFDLPRDYCERYDFRPVDEALSELLHGNRVAEVGRFAVDGQRRARFVIAASLMRAVATAAVERGCTHLITDVLENDPRSPYRFHKRVLGFEVVATHDGGVSKSSSQRLTLMLDLAAAYQRMKPRNEWMCRYITDGWKPEVLQRLDGSGS